MAQPDACLVPTAPLADILDRFFAQWKSDRPPTGGQFGVEPKVSPIRAAEWLATAALVWSEIEQHFQPVSESTIQNIVDRRYRMTEFRIADAIVGTALGQPYLFHDGTLPVVPNPLASPAARAESCCGGSTALVYL